MAVRPGEADFKSNVLLRDEKGFFGIPFKRLMAAGIGGGFVYVILKMVLGEISIPLGFVAGIVILIMTSLRGGIPRWERIMYRIRGNLSTAMLDDPDSLNAKLGKALELSPEYILLDGDTVFSVVDEAIDTDIDWSEWITFSEAGRGKQSDGLIIVSEPKQHLPIAAASLKGQSS